MQIEGFPAAPFDDGDDMESDRVIGAPRRWLRAEPPSSAPHMAFSLLLAPPQCCARVSPRGMVDVDDTAVARGWEWQKDVAGLAKAAASRASSRRRIVVCARISREKCGRVAWWRILSACVLRHFFVYFFEG